MVKVKVAGFVGYDWIATRYVENYVGKCAEQHSFTTECFVGEDPQTDKFPVFLYPKRASAWSVSFSGTSLNAEDGSKLALTASFDLSENEWILAFLDSTTLKMIKVKITG